MTNEIMRFLPPADSLEVSKDLGSVPTMDTDTNKEQDYENDEARRVESVHPMTGVINVVKKDIHDAKQAIRTEEIVDEAEVNAFLGRTVIGFAAGITCFFIIAAFIHLYVLYPLAETNFFFEVITPFVFLGITMGGGLTTGIVLGRQQRLNGTSLVGLAVCTSIMLSFYHFTPVFDDFSVNLSADKAAVEIDD